MLDISITEVVFNLASTLTAALLPTNSDKFLRKASTVLIKMVGIHPPQESQINFHHSSESNTFPRRKPKIRRTLQIHRINVDNNNNEVRSTSSKVFETKSFQNFLHYHKLKYLSYKRRFNNSLKNKRIMFTIQEAEE